MQILRADEVNELSKLDMSTTIEHIYYRIIKDACDGKTYTLFPIDLQEVEVIYLKVYFEKYGYKFDYGIFNMKDIGPIWAVKIVWEEMLDDNDLVLINKSDEEEEEYE